MSDFDTPDVEEILQADETDVPVVPVSVENLVRTEESPTTTGGVRQFRDVGTSGIQILNYHPQRKRATIIADNDIYIANNLGTVQGRSAKWPANIALVLTSSDEWYAAAVTATTSITVISEDWAR